MIDQWSVQYVVTGFLLGQLLALCNTATGITSELLTTKIKVNIPTFQSFLTYLAVSLSYGVYHVYHHGLAKFRSRVGAWCLFLASTDFLATFMMVKAYQYTSLVSVQLLDCVSIPTIMILSCLFFRTRYRVTQYFAVVICLTGVASMVFVDSHTDSSLKGDVLVVAGAVLYGLNNVCLEWLTKQIGPYTYLGVYCWFGLVISGIQAVLIEREALAGAPWDCADFYLCLLGFAAFLFTFLSLMPIIMIKYSATVANLNLLAADVYSAVAGYLIFSVKFSPLYVAAIVLILVGVLLFIQQSHTRSRVGTQGAELEDGSGESLVAGSEQNEVASLSNIIAL